jgi:hypothetical protein
MSLSPSRRLDILVLCHSYLNTGNKYSPEPHPPVFLFLYNKDKKDYDKINITDRAVPEPFADGLLNLFELAEEQNIHIKFMDDAVRDKDIDEYQYNSIETLLEEKLKFDYIFPIKCTGKVALKYMPFLKPHGKMLEPNFKVEPDFVTPALRGQIIAARQTFPSVIDGQKVIEFHAYLASKELYISKDDEDINEGYGWYIIHSPVAISRSKSKSKSRSRSRIRSRSRSRSRSKSGGKKSKKTKKIKSKK